MTITLRRQPDLRRIENEWLSLEILDQNAEITATLKMTDYDYGTLRLVEGREMFGITAMGDRNISYVTQWLLHYRNNDFQLILRNPAIEKAPNKPRAEVREELRPLSPCLIPAPRRIAHGRHPARRRIAHLRTGVAAMRAFYSCRACLLSPALKAFSCQRPRITLPPALSSCGVSRAQTACLGAANLAELAGALAPPGPWRSALRPWGAATA